jgi:hypothetical protein
MIRYLSGTYWSISRTPVLSSTVKKLIVEVNQIIAYYWVKDRRSTSVIHKSGRVTHKIHNNELLDDNFSGVGREK